MTTNILLKNMPNIQPSHLCISVKINTTIDHPKINLLHPKTFHSPPHSFIPSKAIPTQNPSYVSSIPEPQHPGSHKRPSLQVLAHAKPLLSRLTHLPANSRLTFLLPLTTSPFPSSSNIARTMNSPHMLCRNLVVTTSFSL